MALELRISGPGIDVTRRVEPGAPPLILGRDPECAVTLPDPERNVSRKHLSLWLDGAELRFLVLSVVNGVELPSGEVPPGAAGVLPAGETLKIAEYLVTALPAEDEEPTLPPGTEPPPLPVTRGAAPTAPPEVDADPWADLDTQELPAKHPAPFDAAPQPADADPFGEWGFDTYGADAPGGGLQAEGLGFAADLSALYEGIGLDPSRVGPLSQGELETLGRIVRIALLGLVELHRSVAGSRQELHSEDRTMMAAREERNPLKEGNLPEEAVLLYLFGGRAASAPGFVGPERAVRDLVADLAAHETATTAAARAAVEGVLREFDPEALKSRLLGGGARLFESARAWDAFVKDYEAQSGDGAQWVQRLLGKYFTSTYVRETARGAKRDTVGRSR